MDFILQLAFYVLAFNAVLILLIFLWYFSIGRHKEDAVDFEEYVASLFSIGKIRDPWILVDGIWVKTDKASLNL